MELDNTHLPAFQHIEIDHIEPAIDTLLTDNRAAIAARLQTGEPYTWENILYPLEDLQDRLNRAWSPVRHLHGVADNDALRRVYNACLVKLSDYATEVGQNEGLYRAYNYVKEHGQYERLGNAERKIIDNALRDFRLSGVALSPADKDRFKQIKQALSQLQTQFEEHVLDATQASDRGPMAGKWDNTEVMAEILRLRQELAKLLGFAHYADYSLATKMAREPAQVIEFLGDLARRSRPVAERELAELKAFAAQQYGIKELEAWDIPYYSEKLRQHHYAISQEELRPYFPAPRVVQGLFAVVRRLYGLRIERWTGVETWHPEVEFYALYDAANSLRGLFYLDLYARPHKRGGAWMDECIVRKRTATGIQHPVAYLTCNLTPPVGEDPSLLTHKEVITLFHEFGHGLHHLLTLVDYPSVAGINGVPWDAVELPSQFMENWCWEREALDLIGGHYQTGEPISSTLLERMLAAKNFQSGMQMVRQLELALFDFRLHSLPGTIEGPAIQKLLDEVRAEVAVVKLPTFNRFQHSFGHIFAGGYAAGYYSYKWAKVLAADAFSRFLECGIFDRESGVAFLQSILEPGGSRDPMELFTAFRGREPRIEPLLRHSGILA